MQTALLQLLQKIQRHLRLADLHLKLAHMLRHRRSHPALGPGALVANLGQQRAPRGSNRRRRPRLRPAHGADAPRRAPPAIRVLLTGRQTGSVG
jgi:hypothetical protein